MYVYIIIYSNYYDYKCDNNKITTNVPFVFRFFFFMFYTVAIPYTRLNFIAARHRRRQDCIKPTTFIPCDNPEDF